MKNILISIVSIAIFLIPGAVYSQDSVLLIGAGETCSQFGYVEMTIEECEAYANETGATWWGDGGPEGGGCVNWGSAFEYSGSPPGIELPCPVTTGDCYCVLPTSDGPDEPDLFDVSAEGSQFQSFYYFESVEINGAAVVADDWVGAFYGDMCVGAQQWDENNSDLCYGGTCSVTVLHSDGNSYTAGYPTEGDLITFKIYDASEDIYYDATPSVNLQANLGWLVLSNLNNIVSGCPDYLGCNYNSEATVDNGSCLYNDCAGECGGSAVVDECGVCGGDNTSCEIPGDMNGDGQINVIDIVMQVDLILNNNYDVVGDVNADELLNVLDIVMLVNIILGDTPEDDADGDGVIDDEDSDPSNPYECSDTDGDTCEDCISGSYDPSMDGYDPDGDGQCEDGNCFLYITLAENELEDIFFNIYNNEDFAYCLDNLDEYPSCIGDLLELDNVIYLYDMTAFMCPENPAANFGSAIVNLMSIATDPELNELLNRWFEYFNSQDESRGKLSGYNMGIPSRETSYDEFSSSSAYSMLSNLIVNPTNVLGRSTEDAPYLSELQELLESEFIPRINSAINKMEHVIDEDYNFILTGEMQGDIYQDDIQMDDTEFYLMKAYMHYSNALFHIISTYDISEITVDINDYTVLNQNHPFLTIRAGRESYMPFAYQQLNNLYASLESSFNFLINETDFQENDYIQNDISDDHYIEIVDNLDTLEDCLDGECIASMQGCDNWECSFEYDGYWQNYDCECVGETIEMEHAISLSSFMNNPPQNLKEYIPDYAITNDECASGSGDEMLFTVGSGMAINSFSIIFDSDPYYYYYNGNQGGNSRDFKSITINTTSGSYTINRPDNWASLSPQPPDPSEELPDWMNGNQTRTHLNWHLVQTSSSEYYITADDGFQPTLYITLYEWNVWDLVSDHYFSDYYSNTYGYSCCGGVSASSSNSNPFPCPQLTWIAPSYNQWVSEWNGDGMTIDINANNGINSLSFAFEGDPFYWSDYGYYARKFNSITINSAFGETTITRPDNWDDMRSNDYEFPELNEDLPDWIDRYQLRNPMAWHLVSMGSGDVFYVFASDDDSEIYSLLYSDNYWGMDSNNSFSDHWIDFTTDGSFILSFNGTAYAQAQQPIDITISGLYPEITLEDVLLLYKNLFNIDANNWNQTIGGD